MTTDRRSFLFPTGATAADIRPAVEPGEPIVEWQREAMACPFVIQFPNRVEDRRPAVLAFDRFDDLEAQLSVYRDDSEVSQLNASAGHRPVAVESSLFDLLTLCRDFHDRTDKAFDITAGPLIALWGFKRRQGRVPTTQEINETLQRVGMTNVELDRKSQTVRFRVAGMELNFGAVGKGYALDRAAESFRSTNFGPALLSAGHSSLLAISPVSDPRSWSVSVADPVRRDQPVAVVRLVNQGMSTSGVSEQFFAHAGKRYGHLLDPRTGWPVKGMRQAVAVAPTAAEAEILSTACFVNGIDWARQYCQSHVNVGTILFPEPTDHRHPPAVVIGQIAADLTSGRPTPAQ